MLAADPKCGHEKHAGAIEERTCTMNPNQLIVFLAVFLGFVGEHRSHAQAPTDERLKYMRGVIDAIEVKLLGRDSKSPIKFHPKPILRFGDLARGSSDGALWKLGSHRPQAIIALEFYEFEQKQHLCYEFLCLTEDRFELHTKSGWKWTPAKSALEFKELKNVRPPGDSSLVRLRQMKRLAKRFKATEKFEDEEHELRLMPQPIDHYVIDDSEKSRRGAIFVFAHGTNPEVLLLIEPLQAGWQYGLSRMTGATCSVKLGDHVVWEKPRMTEVGKSWKLDYTGDAHASDLSEASTP